MNGVMGEGLSAINQRLLIRLSLVVGIYKDLQIVFWSSTARADSWISTPDSTRLFAGLSPIQFMLTRDNEQIKKIRDHIQKMIFEKNKGIESVGTFDEQSWSMKIRKFGREKSVSKPMSITVLGGKSICMTIQPCGLDFW